jgi:hypothetical protein
MKRKPNIHFKSWLLAATPAERIAAAKKAGTSVHYFWQISGGHSVPSPKLAIKLESATGVHKELLRPDIWTKAA